MFDASRERRASEIAAWSNATASLGLGVGVLLMVHSWLAAVATAVLALVLLRGALAHRVTVWIAASAGTLAVAMVGGSLVWLFAHVIDVGAAPIIGAVLGAVASAIAPSWAYARLAQRRAERIRDSLLEPVPSR